jgi:hypothetical protein
LSAAKLSQAIDLDVAQRLGDEIDVGFPKLVRRIRVGHRYTPQSGGPGRLDSPRRILNGHTLRRFEVLP